MSLALVPAPEMSPGRYRHSADLSSLLQELGISLLVSTYQAGKLVTVRAGQGRLSSLLRSGS
jgi:hypothetical protein